MREFGLTLIEVLIAMGISIAVTGLLVVIMISSAGLFSRQSTNLQQGLNINDALMNVRQNIKQAKAVESSFVDGTTTYTSSPETLILKIPSIDTSGSIISNTFDRAVFFKDANKLRWKMITDPLSSRKSQDQIFSTSLDSLKFQFFNSDNPPLEVIPALSAKVRITLTVKQKVGTSFQQQTATSEAALRND